MIHILQIKKPSSANLDKFNNLLKVYFKQLLSWGIKIKTQVYLVLKYGYFSLCYVSWWERNSSCEPDFYVVLDLPFPNPVSLDDGAYHLNLICKMAVTRLTPRNVVSIKLEST